MPLMKLCRCGKLIELGKKRCDDCEMKAKQARQQYHRQYDAYARDKKAAAFYNSPEWDRVRYLALTRDFGLCQDCLDEKKITPAYVVDHVKPLKLFWHLRLSLDNLRSLCSKHHAIKTAEDRRKYGVGRV